MGMILKIVVAFCVGGGLLVGAQHFWMSSMAAQIRVAAARSNPLLPQTPFKPAISIDADKFRQALKPMAPLDTSAYQRLGVEGAARRIDMQVRNAQPAVPRSTPGLR